MTRHGYFDDLDDDLAMGRWRGAVLSAIRGKRGQAFMRELIESLDAMSEKRLVAEVLVTEGGDVCAMGCVLAKRGLDASTLDPEEPESVAAVIGLNEKMVREIAYKNDVGGWGETPEQRWSRMRRWAEKQLTKPTPEKEPAP